MREKQQLTLHKTMQAKVPHKLRRDTKASHRPKKMETLEERERFKPKRKKSTAKRRLRRKLRGLYANNGMIKPDTKVFYDTVTNRDLSQDPMFDCPMKPIRLQVRPDLFKKLKGYEEEIKAIVAGKNAYGYKNGLLSHIEFATGATKLDWHKYGGNKGVNWGISVVPAGPESDKIDGVSGTVQQSAKYYKKYPHLARKVHAVLQEILDDAFGQQLWYNRLKAYTKRLNEQMGEERVVEGCVFSGAWLTLLTKECAIHKDHNVVGPSFLLSTYNPEGLEGCLTIKSENAIHPEDIIINQGTVLGGSWATQEHCNRNVGRRTIDRTSWVLYLDKRVFGANYKFNS